MKTWRGVFLGSLAALVLVARDAHAAMEVVGTDADKTAFNDMIEACKKKSPSFKKEMDDEVENPKTATITVNVGHVGAVLDSAGTGASTTVNLDNLNAMPDVEPDGKGGFTMTEGHPPWAMTRCELLMHFLRETYYTASNQNKGLSYDAHKAGIDAQARVRKDFKQKEHARTQTLEPSSENFKYVDVDLNIYHEHLSFDENGKLVITYFRGKTTELRWVKDDKGGHWEQYEHDKWSRSPPFAMADLPREGPTFAVGFGVGLPFGNYQSGNPQSDEYAATLPIQIDAGYRFDFGLYAGAYASFGPAFLGSSCPTSCSGNDLRFGVDAKYHFLQDEIIHPWAGLAFGYELAHAAGTSSGGAFSQTGKGFEFLQVQAGGDYALTPATSIGPFIQLGLGTYASQSGSFAGADYSTSIANTAVHGSLTIGVRGEYTLPLDVSANRDVVWT